MEHKQFDFLPDDFYERSKSERQKWLESSSLYEMIEEQTRQMITDTVKDFGDKIVIIYR